MNRKSLLFIIDQPYKINRIFMCVENLKACLFQESFSWLRLIIKKLYIFPS